MEDEEGFYAPRKEVKANLVHKFRRKHLNKISHHSASHLSEKLLRVSPKDFRLSDIYFAASPISSPLKYPVQLPQFATYRSDFYLKLLQVISSAATENIDPDCHQFKCNSVLLEKLDSIQELWRREVYHYQEGFGLTLKPITRPFELGVFKSASEFRSIVNSTVWEIFGNNENTIIVDPQDFANTPEITLTPACAVEVGQPFEDIAKSMIIFDKDIHNIVLIPPFPKNRLHFDIKCEFQFPFKAQFVTSESQVLKTAFQFPLKFQREPQRFRLKFYFFQGNLEIIVYSQVNVFSVIPDFVNAQSQRFGSAKIEVYDYQLSKPQVLLDDSLGKKFNRELLDHSAIDKYWARGNRIRYKETHIQALNYEGFQIGFNYLYEIKVRPNVEMQIQKHKERIRTRKEIRRQINTDLDDFYHLDG